MTNLQERDIALGQLALARGYISFATLIQAIHHAARHELALQEYLRTHHILTRAQTEELVRDLARAHSKEAIEHELQTGQTLLLDMIEQASSSSVRLLDQDGEPSESELLPLQVTLGADAAAPLPLLSLPHAALEDNVEFPPQRYRLVRILGKGGMGQVWLAHDQYLNREVALKVLRPDDLDHVTLFERQLKLEAQITGLLEHPSIIPVYDLGKLPDKGLYYTMRVVREESLEKRLLQIDEQPEAFTLSHMVGILRTALLALHYAHDHGIVHRDLKPENILVGKYGEVFIIDWGVAKVTEKSKNSSLQRFSPTRTKQGALVGTPNYMAPEQALGENELVDERTDIYAMGVILYEMLTLQKVFEAGHVLALLLKVTESRPTPPSVRTPDRHIPRELEEICLRAIEKEREDRYQSAKEMAHDLELFLEGVKEKERHQQLAHTFLAEATRHRKAYQNAQKELLASSRKLKLAQEEMPSWASIEEKEPMWHMEQEVEHMRLNLERHFGEALRCYGQALGYVPNHGEARRGMAELYWQRFLRAEQGGDEANAIYFEGLVRQYNDGQYNTLLAGLATLSIKTNAPHSVFTIYRYEKGLHRLRAIHQATFQGAVINQRLPHGSYLITVEAPGHMPLRVPLLLQRLGIYQLDLELYALGSFPPDLIVVTEGEFLSGNLQDKDRSQCTQHLGRFAIMRHPVTCKNYVDFLNGLITQGRLEEALARSPRVRDDSRSYFTLDEGTGRIIIPEVDQDGTSWDPDWPIVLVSYEDAEAYAAWRSSRDGLSYHIPEAAQLEKAARGVDGRIFVWGNDFDPSFCRMRESEQGRPFPASIHAYPIDCSPYGVMQLNGNVAEWSSTWASREDRTKIMRGGSYSSSSQGCRLDWPLSSPCDFRYSSYGFRLAIDL